MEAARDVSATTKVFAGWYEWYVERGSSVRGGGVVPLSSAGGSEVPLSSGDPGEGLRESGGELGEELDESLVTVRGLIEGWFGLGEYEYEYWVGDHYCDD